MSFKLERKSMNRGVLRVEGIDEEMVKISILNAAGDHYRGIAKLGFGDAADIVAELVPFLYGEGAYIEVINAG